MINAKAPAMHAGAFVRRVISAAEIEHHSAVDTGCIR